MSHWKRHGNGKKLSTVVKPSCELLFLLRLADFNVVHHFWGQSPGKSADHSNKSFLGLSSYLDMRVKWEVSLGLPRWRQLFRALAWGTWCRNCAREAGCFLQTPHLDFPLCRRAVLLATLWAGAGAAHQLGMACGAKIVPVTGLVTVYTGHDHPVRPNNLILWVQCAASREKWNC